MATATNPKSGPFQMGNTCLVIVMNQKFWVTIQDVESDRVFTTFPGDDYPIANIPATIEFHEASGYHRAETEILQGPMECGGGLVLKRPAHVEYIQHRGAIRLDTDLTVHLRDQVHVRRYDGDLINLSSTGAYVRSEIPLDLDATVEMTISLPEEARQDVLGMVVHVEAASEAFDGETLFGIRFSDPDPSAQRALSRFIYKRLLEQYRENRIPPPRQ